MAVRPKALRPKAVGLQKFGKSGVVGLVVFKGHGVVSYIRCLK